MKITDTTGRSMLVDLVYKDPQRGWLQASTYQLKGRSTIYARVPYGAYALRVCSMIGAEIVLFEDGQKLIQTAVPVRTQFIEADSNGRALTFAAPGDKQRQPDNDLATKQTANSLEAGEAASTEGSTVSFVPPVAPAGHGTVFAVVRFAKQNSPHGEPPQEEFEIAFQMHEPEQSSEHFAQNFRLVAEAHALPNPRDEFSREPAAADSRTHFHCTFTGCNH